MLCDKLYRIEFDETKLDPDYAVHLLRSQAARFQFERDATGASASMKTISVDRVENLILAFPDIAEQKRILSHLRENLARVSTLAQRIGYWSDKLGEYRMSLISAAVTGQIDVRSHREEAPCP
jgi:type I restriction enzyme, S subunit